MITQGMPESQDIKASGGEMKKETDYTKSSYKQPLCGIEWYEVHKDDKVPPQFLELLVDGVPRSRFFSSMKGTKKAFRLIMKGGK